MCLVWCVLYTYIIIFQNLIAVSTPLTGRQAGRQTDRHTHTLRNIEREKEKGRDSG